MTGHRQEMSSRFRRLVFIEFAIEVRRMPEYFSTFRLFRLDFDARLASKGGCRRAYNYIASSVNISASRLKSPLTTIRVTSSNFCRLGRLP